MVAASVIKMGVLAEIVNLVQNDRLSGCGQTRKNEGFGG